MSPAKDRIAEVLSDMGYEYTNAVYDEDDNLSYVVYRRPPEKNSPLGPLLWEEMVRRLNESPRD